MPRYDYRCPRGHVTEHTFRMADKPETVPCAFGLHVGRPACGEPAESVILTAPAVNGISQIHAPIDPPRNEGVALLRWKDGTCACGTVTTVFIDADGIPEPTSCDACASTSLTLSDPKPVPRSVIYPHYDMSLGCEVTSPGHRAKLMRERGFIDADSRDIMEARERQASRQVEEDARVHAEYQRQMEHPTTKGILESDWYADTVKEAIAQELKDAPDPSHYAQPAF